MCTFKTKTFSILTFMTYLIFNGMAVAVNTNQTGINKKTLSRIEPPFWWIGMKEKQLQLMLHGENIARFNVTSENRGWKIESLQRTDNNNYLFVNILVDENANEGTYTLYLEEKNAEQQTIKYELKARQDGSSRREGFSSSDVIYLITPDRFANGDTTNDQIEGYKDKLNRRHENGRHGGDIQGVIEHLNYIEDMGFTQIWLNPVLENNHPRSSYHGYSTTDYYKIDPRFGTNDLYRALSIKAKSKGIGLIKDVVLNHIGTEHWWMKDLPSKDWINNNSINKNGSNNKSLYVETTHRREALHDPHGTAEDIDAFANGWFVPTMADLNQKNPMLANYIIQNNIWWIEFAELSGIRVDTYSYSDKQFLADYTKRIMTEYPHFNIVAEEWSLSPAIVSYWQRGNQPYDGYQSELPSLMDFPLQDRLIKALKEKETWSDGLQKLYEILAIDFLYNDPDNLVVFPDNHDMSRIFTQLEHDQALTKIALAYIATTRGIPQYFYGTEILMDNKGSGSHGVIRSDFPGGWKTDLVNAFTGKGLDNSQSEMQLFMKKLLNWRKKSEAIHQGKLTHYAPEKGVYVYFRHTNKDKVMVVINKTDRTMIINPALYPSMINFDTSEKLAIEVINEKEYSMNHSFNISAKSILILQF